MNERIRELAEQSGAQPTNLPPNVTLDWQKFAELIVRECAEVSENYAAGSMPLSIAHAIKKHFGVEE